MQKLISKVQFRNCEQGEFYDCKERSFEDLIMLADEFPWENQRKDLKVDLTNPSIVIETSQDTFLQLALYYNGKFVLRFVDQNDQLFSMSLINREEANNQIRSLYEGLFSTKGFKKENTWLKKNRPNFISQSFRYSVDRTAALRFLWHTTGFNIIAFLAFLVIIFSVSPNNGGKLWIPISAVFTLFLGINLLLFTNHYLRLKGKILQVSKGNSTLYYGDSKGLSKYSKTEISEVEVINANNSRSPFNGFYVFKIKFKSGEVLRLSNIFEDASKIMEKFYDCRLVIRSGFAII